MARPANRFRIAANAAFARAGLAVMEQFKEEPGKVVALLLRWSELTRLMNDHRMQSYMRKSSDGSGAADLRVEAIEVAAELPFDEHMGFNAQEFFRRLRARLAHR
jgi:hypothetical protein